MTGYHRKYLTRLMSDAGLRKGKGGRSSRPRYGSSEVRLLYALRKRADRLSAERFREQLPPLRSVEHSINRPP